MLGRFLSTDNPTTNEFGVRAANGNIRTYYIPDPAIHGFRPTWTTSMHSDSYVCPVCGFKGLEEAPYDAHGCTTFVICPSCGTEFGYDDSTTAHTELRRRWIENGMQWSSKAKPPPPAWSPSKQLASAGLLN